MDKPDVLYRVMYISRATRPLGEDALRALFAGSRARNKARGITGMVLYHAGHFAQVLEGPSGAVGALMAAVQSDPRHDHIVVLSAGPVAERLFDGHSMDWAHLDQDTDSQHAELRRYMLHHHIADRETVHQALVLFVMEHSGKTRASGKMPDLDPDR